MKRKLTYKFMKLTFRQTRKQLHQWIMSIVQLLIVVREPIVAQTNEFAIEKDVQKPNLTDQMNEIEQFTTNE